MDGAPSVADADGRYTVSEVGSVPQGGFVDTILFGGSGAGRARLASDRGRRFLTVGVVVVLMAAIALPLGTANEAWSRRIRAVAPSAVRLVVRFRPGVDVEHAVASLRRSGMRDIRALPELGAALVTVPKAAVGLAVSRLRADAAVAAAGADGISKPAEAMPDDPFFPQDYALGGGAWGWFKTRTTQAWDVTTGDPSVVIAIVDTGLKNVPDLAGQTVPGWNVLTNSSDVTTNAGNHGTYVAGVAGLAMNNGIGGAGYCPGCRIMPVQVGSDSGAYNSDIASGITWAADHGARIINLSWAGTSSSSLFDSAVSYARSKGAVVVAAAGNTNCDCPNYPAATAGVLGVGGTTSTDTKQGDSNYGSWLTMAAPEGDMTAWPTYNGAPGYAPVGGTSMAAPVVAGIAGLLFSYAPSATGVQVEQALESSAVPLSWNVKYGRVDAMGALAALGAIDPQPTSVPVNAEAPQVLAMSSTGGDTSPLTGAPVVGQVLTRGQGAWNGSAPLSLYSVVWQRCKVGGSCTSIVNSDSYTVQSADSGYAIRVVVTAKNSIGSTAAASVQTLPVGSGGTVTTTVPPPTSTTTTLAPTTTTTDTTAPTTTTTTTTVPLPVVTTTTTPAPVPPATTVTSTWSGMISPKGGSKSFSMNAGAGSSHATLSFACSSLSLAVTAGRKSLGSTSGPSVVTFDATIPAGSDTWTVSGKGKCSFTLTVTTPSP